MMLSPGIIQGVRSTRKAATEEYETARKTLMAATTQTWLMATWPHNPGIRRMEMNIGTKPAIRFSGIAIIAVAISSLVVLSASARDTVLPLAAIRCAPKTLLIIDLAAAEITSSTVLPENLGSPVVIAATRSDSLIVGCTPRRFQVSDYSTLFEFDIKTLSVRRIFGPWTDESGKSASLGEIYDFHLFPNNKILLFGCQAATGARPGSLVLDLNAGRIIGHTSVFARRYMWLNDNATSVAWLDWKFSDEHPSIKTQSLFPESQTESAQALSKEFRAAPAQALERSIVVRATADSGKLTWLVAGERRRAPDSVDYSGNTYRLYSRSGLGSAVDVASGMLVVPTGNIIVVIDVNSGRVEKIVGLGECAFPTNIALLPRPS